MCTKDNSRKYGIGKTIYSDGTVWEGEYRDGVNWDNQIQEW